MNEDERNRQRSQNEDEVIFLRDRLAEVEKSSELHNKAKNILADAYNELHTKFVDAEKRAQAAEVVVEAWRAARGFGELRENSVAWDSVRRMDAAVLKYDSEKG